MNKDIGVVINPVVWIRFHLAKVCLVFASQSMWPLPSAAPYKLGEIFCALWSVNTEAASTQT